MFQKIDCVRIHVSDIDPALAFYQTKLGLELVWRRENSEAGLRMQNSESELVLVSEDLNNLGVDILVKDVDRDDIDFQEKSGKIIVSSFDIAMGRCAVVQDPWDNKYVILDLIEGHLKMDSKKNVISPA
jgi:lactoylglutathione lyase